MNDVVNIRRIANEEIDRRLASFALDQSAKAVQREREEIIELITQQCAATPFYSAHSMRLREALVEAIRARASQ